MTGHYRHRAAAALLALATAGPVAAQTLPGVTVSGDLRVRLEDDWDSHTATDALRPDRGRARIRARLGAAVDLGDGVTLQGRLRTGVEHGQQNANITFADFNGNPVDIFKIAAERYSLAWKGRRGGAEVGKMAFPFFTTNEYFWDADISPLGGAANVAVPLAGKTALRVIGGGFALPAGLAGFSGHLVAGQAVVEAGPATVAAGLYRFLPDRGDHDRLLLLDGNGSRDYAVLALNGQYKLTAAAKPLALTADFYRNLQGYSTDPDPISRAFAHERTGFVLAAIWGDVARPHHLQIGYRYFRMEKLAVNSSYSHDDLARLGTASQASLTDLTGHDLYANWAVAKHWTLGTRVIFAHRLSNVEDDKRARVDLGFAF